MSQTFLIRLFYMRLTREARSLIDAIDLPAAARTSGRGAEREVKSQAVAGRGRGTRRPWDSGPARLDLQRSEAVSMSELEASGRRLAEERIESSSGARRFEAYYALQEVVALSLIHI